MDEGASPPTESNRTPNAGGPERGSQSMWAKLCAREGNSPDRPLRSPSSSRVAKDVRPPRQPGCWLRSSHPFTECVPAHWSSGHAPTKHGAKLDTEAAGFYLLESVGELPMGGEAGGRPTVERMGVRMLA